MTDQVQPPIEAKDAPSQELTTQQLEEVDGGVTFQDFHFTATVNKSSPS